MRSASPARRDRERRFAALVTITLAGFALIVLGLLSEENRIRLEVLRAPRGAIFDRNGELLADSYPSFNIVFRPMPAESTARTPATVRADWVHRVSALVEADSSTIHQLVRAANRSGQTAILRRNAPFAILAGIEEHRAQLPGVEVLVGPLRRYPHGTLAAHLLGYAGQINDRDLETRAAEGYHPGELIGRTGLERSFEGTLRGQDGAEYVVVNAMGKRVSTLTEVPPRPPVAGRSLVLTLDLKVQRALEDAMAGVVRGAAVAIDPRDGGILAMVSRPDYDPNEFSRGLTGARWKALTGDGSNPLLNRAIQGQYPPGSTFKIVTMVAALREGVARPETMFQPCYGSYQFGGRSFGCWKPSGHGSLDLVSALQHSCDVYFYQLGMRLGLPRLEATARALGLGGRTGVDLPQESGGFIPSADWYDARWGNGHWRKGVILNLAIGQGEILVTPIQLALMAGEVAADGRALRPHVVLSVGDGPPATPPHPLQTGIKAEAAVWDPVHQGLEQVVAAGTGTAARVPGLAVAGKTGTAQNPHGKDHALFVCYAPAAQPTIAMAIVIENIGHGGTFAAPVAAQTLRQLFLADSLQKRVAPVVRPDTTGGVHGD